MSRRFEEVVLESEGVTPPRCPFCRSPRIQSSNTLDIEQQAGLTLGLLRHVNNLNWMQCNNCKYLWVKL